MGVYVFDGSNSYTGTDGDDQFYMQNATVPVSVNGLDGSEYVRGGPHNDLLDGGAGKDYIYGGDGSDTIHGGPGDDVLYGDVDDGQGNFRSDNSDDAVYGDEGNDFIYVGYRDTAYGGAGDDVYVLLSGTSIVEQQNEGIDTVYASGGYTLPDNVENLIMSPARGVFSPNGVGNDLDNVMRIADTGISGGLAGRGGNDLLYGSSADNDYLWGDDGNDTLIGGPGGDYMAGGPGNDIYSVDQIGDGYYVATDRVEEHPGEGYDEVYASVNYQLPENVETLFLTGTAVYGTGNSGNNAIIGNDADNVLQAGTGAFNFLNGAAGNDILISGPGHDEMMGGAGADLFRFNVPTSGPDFIYDFTPGQDHIQLNASAFGFTGVTDGTTFISGNAPAPVQAGPTLEYNNTTGYLFYDGDGTGPNAPVVLALLNGVPNLHASDFAFF